MIGKGVFRTIKGQTVFGTWVPRRSTKELKYKFQPFMAENSINDSANTSISKHYCGFGSELWNDGSYYRGDFNKGEKHGKGVYYWFDGSCYTGDFESNHLHGKGDFRWNHNRRYVGTFINGQMHGEGTYFWPDGRKYIGYYKNNVKHGPGTYYNLDGTMCRGMWNMGHLISGKLFDASGQEIKEVNFGVEISSKNTNTQLTSEAVSPEKVRNLKQRTAP